MYIRKKGTSKYVQDVNKKGNLQMEGPPDVFFVFCSYIPALFFVYFSSALSEQKGSVHSLHWNI